jgi:hypothetical protein
MSHEPIHNPTHLCRLHATPQPHQCFPELIPPLSILPNPPERVRRTILHELRITSIVQHISEPEVLREFELKHAVHGTQVNVEPVGTLETTETLGLLEGFTCGAEVANAFGEFRAVVKKLMGLEH